MASRPQLNQSEVGRLDGRVVVLGRWLYDWLISTGRNPVFAVTTPAPGPSPWDYQNASGFDLDMSITSGNVSAIEFIRDGVLTLLNTTTPYVVRLSPGDTVRVHYTVAPGVAIIPR